MIRKTYTESGIEFGCFNELEQIVEFDNWLKSTPPVLFNTLNDLRVNGQLFSIDNERLFLPYEELSNLDDYEIEILELPPYYPFDIFIDIKGTGLKDTSLKINCTFQDFAHGNGTGNVLVFDRKGAYLNGIIEYVLNSEQYLLFKQIDKINSTHFQHSNHVLVEIGELQQKAAAANAILSKILTDTSIIPLAKVQLDIEKIDDDKYRLKPVINNEESSKFQEKFNLFPSIKPEYHFRDNNSKFHVVLKDDDGSNSLKNELSKLKVKQIYTQEDLIENYNSPSKFWDQDLIDLDLFSKRVVELGIYKPKFYPFISPYKSEWIPGIAIEDRISGTRLVNIKNESELLELKEKLAEASSRGSKTFQFKGEELETKEVESFIPTFEDQLRNPSSPITKDQSDERTELNQPKVLIIKENTELLEYDESLNVCEIDKFNFECIDNLSKDIQLKDHQIEGIAWLQTLYLPPNSFPGVLLADDMGLGKTLQVLYFIEWYMQKQKQNPILVVAPVSLLENWQNEYSKFFPSPSMEIITLWGSRLRQYVDINDWESTRSKLSVNAIFLTTYETVRKQQVLLGMIDWGVIILDEVQKIKTPGTLVTNAAKALKSDFRIAMTGTPVENSLMDLWCIIDFCCPGLLSNASDFAKKYHTPQKQQNTRSVELSNQLRTEIGNALLRRMKNDVLKDLPSINFYIQKETMPRVQYNAYLNELQSVKENSTGGNDILRVLLNLRTISDHPLLKHYQLENLPTDELIETSAKLRKVISLLAEIKSKEEKVILFTENRSMQRVLRKVLHDKYNLSASIINGETPSSVTDKKRGRLSRQQEVDKFQAEVGFNAIIMSPLAAGFGLNITEANHVIHYSRHWNPAKEQQATDRVFRIGQKKEVHVYYPMAVAPDDEIKTFDIILNNLLSRKTDLAQITLFPTEQIEISREEIWDSMGFDGSKAKEKRIKTISELDRLQPLAFEAVIAVLIEKIKGGKTYLTSKSNDKGVDVIHFCDSMNYLIQVKHSINNQGITPGQEVYYALGKFKEKFNKEFNLQAITNRYFTPNAIEFGRLNNVELLDRDTIKTWLMQVSVTTNEIDGKMNERI
ncbi:SNF2-related protein [Mangrovibacterium diazotrophicum]|uniref:SNF2 family DNA or RNA helicase n=1 Tax=Mangrovibacterium diazotrophicum TaxID=1261403 RepID=A0A419W3L5_9BACT|nr:SNF2-related protein [Mangrovibacterium diazotrophicum]RKD90043.1 SNF2 family DNA or RNA helicase [Mangrovibacterium diazotrophicum]